MKNRDDLYASYSAESGRGVFGFILSRGHKKLERIYARLNGISDTPLTVLEIGGARNPHILWMRPNLNVVRYCIEDVDPVSTFNDRCPTSVKKVGYWTDDPTQAVKFDRIIACHVWEHIVHPEVELMKWINLLAPNGVISILLPNDPGLLWGVARRGYFLKLRGHGWKDLREYKYSLALEHVNSIQNLIRIADYFGMSHFVDIKMWPLGLKNVSINMQTIITIKKQ
jgi:phosphatidylethanolamine/phosphatidyl-N-methylethanolamine N-methyltransferase